MIGRMGGSSPTRQFGVVQPGAFWPAAEIHHAKVKLPLRAAEGCLRVV
jgi:hypothetical protein